MNAVHPGIAARWNQYPMPKYQVSSAPLGSDENPYFGGTVPPITIEAENPWGPYYNTLSTEQKNYLRKNPGSNDAIARAIKAQASQGYGIEGNPTFAESTTDAVNQTFQNLGSTAAEATGVPSLYRTGKGLATDPVKFGKDVGNTLTSVAQIANPIGAGSEIYKGLTEDNYYPFISGKNILGQDKWSGLAPTLDASVALPFVGAGARALKGAMPGIKQGLQYTAQHAPALVDQTLSHLLSGSSSRKAMQKGNEWLKKWIQHPTTQTKLKTDITKGTNKLNKDAAGEVNTINKLRDLEYQRNKHLTFEGTPMYLPPRHMPNTPPIKSTSLIKQQQQYSPDVAMYPLKSKWKDFFAGKGVDRNQGVSYRHGLKVDSPWWRSSKPNAESQFDRGTWLSPTARRPESTTIHEGTHDWMTAQALERSGGKSAIEKALLPSTKKQVSKYHKTRDHNKYNEGYLADPAEVHARVMELRRAFNLTPGSKVTPELVSKMQVQNTQRGKQVVDPAFFKLFKSDKTLASLFNKLGVGTAGVVGTGALLQNNKEDSLPSLAHGGNISTTGYLDGSPTAKNLYNVIPSNTLTTKGVSKKLIGIGLDSGEVRFLPKNKKKIVFNKDNAVLELPDTKKNRLKLNIYNKGVNASYQLPVSKNIDFTPNVSLNLEDLKRPNYGASLKYNFKDGGQLPMYQYGDYLPMYQSGGQMDAGAVLGGAAAGASTGMMIGSIFPGPGNIIGAVGGALIGGISNFAKQKKGIKAWEAEQAALAANTKSEEEKQAEYEQSKKEYGAFNQYMDFNRPEDTIDYGGSWQGLETPMTAGTM